MRLRDRFRVWLVKFLRDDDLHGKVNHIGTTLQGVFAEIEEIHTLLPVVQRTLSALVEAEEDRFARLNTREDLRRTDNGAVRSSLAQVHELQERIHQLIAPLVGAPKPKRPPRDWDAVQLENVQQFEESKDGKPVRS